MDSTTFLDSPKPSSSESTLHDEPHFELTKAKHSSDASPTTFLSPQVIEGQYLDQQKLIKLLKDVYGTSQEGKNNFRVEVWLQGSKSPALRTKVRKKLRLNHYKIYRAEHIPDVTDLTPVRITG